MEQQRSAAVTQTVTKEMTARSVGSGSLEVLATPALAALMEKAACAAIEGLLEEGQTSVGVLLDLRHTAATPVGMQVTCQAVLVRQEDRKLIFEITASDEKGEIGSAVHERFTVNKERFQKKALDKLL